MVGGGVSLALLACEASGASLGALPINGTSKALSLSGNGLLSAVGMSPNISRASMASLISLDITGVSTVFDLGADVSLVDS